MSTKSGFKVLFNEKNKDFLLKDFILIELSFNFFNPFLAAASEASAYRLSVFDSRAEPILTMWTAWQGCDVCGTGQTKTRERKCNCPADTNIGVECTTGKFQN